jgi:hypothetical protein
MPETKKELTPEEQKALSNKRIFFAVVVIDLVMVILVVWAIAELFAAK